MKNLYTAHVTSVGGRGGHVESDDKRISFDLTPFDSKSGTNPEQLFAAGYSACFGSALDAVAKSEKVEVSKITVKADVALNQEGSDYSLSATLNVTLPGVDREIAEKLVAKAHQVCPYSKATRGNIEVTLKVNDTPLAKAA
jgi:osmotically inducible protein OsmC